MIARKTEVGTNKNMGMIGRDIEADAEPETKRGRPRQKHMKRDRGG